MASQLTLRKAQQTDCRSLFDLANSPDVRANSVNPDLIEWENHCLWFSKKLKDSSCQFFVADHNDEFVGTVRFDRKCAEEVREVWVVSISLCSKFRGQGLGKEMLKMALSCMTGKVIAFVKKENRASNALFESLSFNHEPESMINGIVLNCYSLNL